MTMNPELLKRQMEITTAPKPAGIRGIELPPPGKTADDMLRPPRKKSVKGPIAVGLATAVAFGAIGTHQYLENPESFNPTNITRSITSFPSAVWDKVVEISNPSNWFKKQEVVVPDTFDPNAKKGVIGANNSVGVPLSDAKTEVDNGKASIPLLIRLPEGYTGPVNYEIRSSIGVRKDNGELINNQLVLSNLPVGTEIISPWDGKINQASGKSPVFSDGSWGDLQAKITARDESGNQFRVSLSTGRVRNVIDSPNTVQAPVLEDDSVPATPIKRGDVLAVIASPANSQYFDGQLRFTFTAGSAIDIQIATQDGKAITLQGLN